MTTTRAVILDRRNEGTSACFLCRINLDDYVNGLPTTYQEYDVQREVVANVYLDHLVDTVLERRHIPPIVLVIAANQYNASQVSLEIESFKILDGLQRTFRLQAIAETIEYSLNNIAGNQIGHVLGQSKFKFSRDYSAALRELNSDTNVLRAVLVKRQEIGDEAVRQIFATSGQWFEVWVGLTPEEEVRKMLTLNAGHKPVKIRHQLEILFLNLLPYLRSGDNEGFKLVREKEVGSTQFSKSREIGSFHFAHLIAAVLSLSAGEPVTPSANLIQGIQANDPDIEDYSPLTSSEYLKDLISFLLKLDKMLAAQYGATGVTWMGREVTLSGLFGALGSVAIKTGQERRAIMDNFLQLLENSPTALALESFESVRNNLDLSKVNIGNANRKAVYSAVSEILLHPTSGVDWVEHFA